MFANCSTGIYNGNIYYSGDIAVSGQNVTADNVTSLLVTWGGDTYAPSSTLTKLHPDECDVSDLLFLRLQLFLGRQFSNL